MSRAITHLTYASAYNAVRGEENQTISCRLITRPPGYNINTDGGTPRCGMRENGLKLKEGVCMRRHIISILSVVLAVILLSLGAGTRVLGADATAAKKVPWKISGQLEEACSCNAACPCWFNSLPSRMNCGGAQVLFISKGHYGKVKLDGLAISHFGQSPDNQTMMESLQSLLRKRKIKFNCIERRIRLENWIHLSYLY